MKYYYFTQFGKTMLYCGAAVALLALAAGSGCRRTPTTTGVRPDGKSTTADSKTGPMDVTVKDKDGKETHFAAGAGGVALPDDFPKDVAVYPKATVVTSMTSSRGMFVALKTTDPAVKVAAFYKDKLKEDGWEIVTSANTGTGTMLIAAKEKEKRGVTILIVADSGETKITLTILPEKQAAAHE
jgi:hypothetical protein